MGTAGRTGVSVSTIDVAQELIDVFSEKYRELDSARIYGDGTTEEVPFPSHSKLCLVHAVNSSCCLSWI
jgi:hypothetical protein